MVRVLPVPAPARMHTGPRTAAAAARCSSSSPARTASAPAVPATGDFSTTRGIPTGSSLPAPADSAGKDPQGRGVGVPADPWTPCAPTRVAEPGTDEGG